VLVTAEMKKEISIKPITHSKQKKKMMKQLVIPDILKPGVHN